MNGLMYEAFVGKRKQGNRKDRGDKKEVGIN